MKQCADDVRAAYPLFQGEGGGSTPTSALDLRIYEIDPRKAQELNRGWHSMLPDTFLGNIVGNRRNVCFGADHEGVWYAVAIWTDPIAANRMKDGDTALELRRFAIAPDAPRYTASRMLAVMTRLIRAKWPELTRLVSYQAVEVHKGTIYRASGWLPAATAEFTPWATRTSGPVKAQGYRKPPQIVSDKVRWEKSL